MEKQWNQRQPPTKKKLAEQFADSLAKMKKGEDYSPKVLKENRSFNQKSLKKDTTEKEGKLIPENQKNTSLQKSNEIKASVVTFFSPAHLVAASNPNMNVKEIRALYGHQELLDPEDDPAPILRPKVPLSLVKNLEGYGKPDENITSKSHRDSNSPLRFEESESLREKTEQIFLQASIGFMGDSLSSMPFSPISKTAFKKKAHHFPSNKYNASKEDSAHILLDTIKSNDNEDVSSIWDR